MLQKTILHLFFMTLISCSSNSKWIKPDQEANTGALYKIDIPVTKVTLENGLRVLIVEKKDLPIFSYYTFFDVGGRYESKGTTGATHFLEHLMFKGSKKYGPGKFDTMIEGSGGSTNAYTTFDSTVYYESLPVDSLETIIDLEADRMSSLIIEPKKFESERQVVLEERRLRYENRPGGKLYLQTMKRLFKGTPYGGSVIGDKEDVENLKIEEVRSFFKKFYAPNNAIVVISGDVDTNKTLEWVKKYYGPLKKSEELQSIKKPLDEEERYKFKYRTSGELKLYGNAPTPMFMMAFRGEKLGSPNSYVLDILGSILGSGESSYLNQIYVDGRHPRLSNIYSYNYTLKNNGTFYISGQLLKKTSINWIKNDLGRNLIRFCDKAITERNLQKAKNQFMVGYYKELTSNSGVAHFLGLRENFFGDYNFYKKELDIYQNITLEQVKYSCKNLFKNNNSLFVSIWNKNPRNK